VSDRVLCPECEKVQGDLWDYEWGQKESLVATCGECGADYLLTRRVSVTYSAERIRKPMDAPCAICGFSFTSTSICGNCASVLDEGGATLPDPEVPLTQEQAQALREAYLKIKNPLYVPLQISKLFPEEK
jgi:hypothetical protein